MSKKIPMRLAIKSFQGFLEGTGRSANTCRNYVLDLEAFAEFCPTIDQITDGVIALFREALKAQGLGANTRRRKLLTLSLFFKYLARRKKIDLLFARKMPAPHKVERIPETVPLADFKAAVLQLPQGPVRLLLWVMIETGCLVSELIKLHRNDWAVPILVIDKGCSRERTLVLSDNMLSSELESMPQGSLFPGRTSVGCMSARAVELVLADLSPQLIGHHVTPRVLRHSVVRFWFEQGVGQDEIKRRLGLKSNYAFKAYGALLDPTFKEHPSPK